MAHIAACMIDSDGETNSLRSYIANTFSTKASTDSVSSHIYITVTTITIILKFDINLDVTMP